jgi:hypothetical protein
VLPEPGADAFRSAQPRRRLTMFVGHYGASFAAKKVDSTIPL